MEAIVEHKVENGELKFLVKWANHEDKTWEPIGHFFHRYAKEFVRYCSEKDLSPDIIGYLSRHPTSDDEDKAEIRNFIAHQLSTKLDWTDPPSDFVFENDDEEEVFDHDTSDMRPTASDTLDISSSDPVTNVKYKPVTLSKLFKGIFNPGKSKGKVRARFLAPHSNNGRN